ncbi:MAG: AtpZ/AtpI family protein [Chloroflexota bacterium]|nr:AtpZ/AtpI family protein [Chloroflexota bacterium]
MYQDQKETTIKEELAEESALQTAPSDRPKASNGARLLAQVSTLAWNLVIPIVGGVLLGHYLDKRSDRGVTWTLSLLVLGVLIAFSNLYSLYIEHKHDHREEEENKVIDKVSHAKEK